MLSRACLWLAIVALLCPPASSQEKGHDLTTLSLEDLMNIQVTSVSKKEQKLSRTAAAVFAITAEDIRRSGGKKYSRSAPHGARRTGSADECEHLGCQRTRPEWPPEQ